MPALRWPLCGCVRPTTCGCLSVRHKLRAQAAHVIPCYQMPHENVDCRVYRCDGISEQSDSLLAACVACAHMHTQDDDIPALVRYHTYEVLKKELNNDRIKWCAGGGPVVACV